MAVVLLFSLFVIEGCRKPENDQGFSVLDPADTLSTVRTDTIGIVTWPRTDDSVRTSNLSTNELGGYMDDRFGAVSTATVTQLRLSVNNIGPADPSLVCDSLILSLAYSTTNPIYGDLDPQVISVFRLNEDLSPDSIYHDDRVPMVDPMDLVQGAPRMFTPSPTAGPVIDGDTLEPQLRIPLSTDLGNEFLSQWGQPTFADDASFLAFFKGLSIAPANAVQAPLQGGVWRLNLLSGSSKMTLYYHNGDGVPFTFDFIIGTGSSRYTHVVFQHAMASVPGVPQALADTSLGQVETYVQSLGGIRTEIRFPNLRQYAGTPYQAVAKAELIIPVSGDFHGTYLPPDQLFAFRKAEDGTDLFVPDQITGQGDVGGFYDTVNKQYRFNLTRWVQGVISGTYPNTGLSLVPGSNGVSVNRAALAGPLGSDRRMKLVLTFTTY